MMLGSKSIAEANERSWVKFLLDKFSLVKFPLRWIVLPPFYTKQYVSGFQPYRASDVLLGKEYAYSQVALAAAYGYHPALFGPLGSPYGWAPR